MVSHDQGQWINFKGGGAKKSVCVSAPLFALCLDIADKYVG